jgi:hypothetical protein
MRLSQIHLLLKGSVPPDETTSRNLRSAPETNWAHPLAFRAPTASMQRRLTMQVRYAIAVVTAILVGFGLKLFFFSAPSAIANTGVVTSVSMNISEIQKNIKNLPVDKINDMTFVSD